MDNINLAWSAEIAEAKNEKDKQRVFKKYADKIFYSLAPKTYPLQDILIYIFDELGLMEDKNSFITFLKIYLKTNNMKEEDLTKLYNLYSDSIIIDEDLRGQTIDKTQEIIFNPNLYQNNDKDFKYITQAYLFMTDAYEMERYVKNIEVLKELMDKINPKWLANIENEDIKNSLGASIDNDIINAAKDKIKDNLNYRELRNYIIFIPADAVNAKIDVMGKINSAKYIKDILGKLSKDEQKDTNISIKNKNEISRKRKENKITDDEKEKFNKIINQIDMEFNRKNILISEPELLDKFIQYIENEYS